MAHAPGYHREPIDASVPIANERNSAQLFADETKSVPPVM